MPIYVRWKRCDVWCKTVHTLYCNASKVAASFIAATRCKTAIIIVFVLPQVLKLHLWGKLSLSCSLEPCALWNHAWARRWSNLWQILFTRTCAFKNTSRNSALQTVNYCRKLEFTWCKTFLCSSYVHISSLGDCQKIVSGEFVIWSYENDPSPDTCILLNMIFLIVRRCFVLITYSNYHLTSLYITTYIHFTIDTLNLVTIFFSPVSARPPHTHDTFILNTENIFVQPF